METSAKMWTYFLICYFTISQIAVNGNATTTWLQKSAIEMSSIAPMMLSQATNSSQSQRSGYDRDLLVVLPVMQGNTDLTNSSLQILYTQSPVTAIINEQPDHQSNSEKIRSSSIFVDTNTFSSTTQIPTFTLQSVDTPRILEKWLERTTSAAIPLSKREDSRHPYTDFLFTKPAPQLQKSPLDYGYPESFKFVQELNELPKNHKPEWAQSDAIEVETKSTMSMEGSTKGNPFQMFESVKPLEINKLLSLKPISTSVTDSLIEETILKRKQESTEITNRFTKRPLPHKRPHKKPQKVKPNPQKLSDAELALFIPTTASVIDKVDGTTTAPTTITNSTASTNTTTTTSTPITSTTTTMVPSSTPVSTTTPNVTTNSTTQGLVSTLSTSKSDDELYDAARYSTLFAESTKAFLPTPYTLSSTNQIATIIRPIETKSTFANHSSNNWSLFTTPMTSTTTRRTTTLLPNFNWTNVNTAPDQVIDTSLPPKGVSQVKPSDLISLTKILDEHFDMKIGQNPLLSGIPSSTTPKPHFPADMLTKDMKNMLVALGILKSEHDSSPLLFTTSTAAPTTTTTNHQQLFNDLFAKREPNTPIIDPNSYVSFKKLPISYEQPQVSNDVRDLLSSFGLLPSAKSNHLGGDSVLTRISRQQKADNSSSTMEMLDGNMRKTLENLGLLKPMAYSYQLHRNGHVFQPSIHLEKLADLQQVEKINSALEIISKLSKSKDAQNLPIEELEQKLRNVTALLRDENMLDANTTHTPDLLPSETSSTAKNFIFYRTNSSQTPTSSVIVASSPLATTLKSTITTPTQEASTTAANSFVNSSRGSISTNSGKNSENNYKRRGGSRSTTTTTSRSTASRISPSTTASTSKIEPNAANSTSGSVDISPDVTQPSAGSSQVEHSDVNYYTPDASSVSVVKLAGNSSTSNAVMLPPPNPLSMEELQNLLESNRNEVKRQQPQEEPATTASTNPSNDGSGDGRSNSSNSDSISGNSGSDNTSSTTSEKTSIKDETTNDNNVSLEALADSFGGDSNAEQGDSWLANAKPNGLYFLLDWNSFLSVGEEDKRPIRIRFSPRAGNPRNFLPIRVP